MSTLTLIAAVARNGTIGATVDGKAVIPWRLPEDMKHFKQLTLGHCVVMGRKTWESLPAAFRPLPGRRNVVVTRNPHYVADGATVATSLDNAIAACAGSTDTVFVMGGGELYAQALPRATRLELTEIDADVAGDTRFPAWDRTAFAEVSRTAHHTAEGLGYAFVRYERRT